MPDFDVFSVLECKKRKSRSHGKRKNGKIKRKICTEKRLNTSLKDLSLALINHGRHGLFSFLSPDPKRIGGYSDQPGVRPSVRLSVRLSVRRQKLVRSITFIPFEIF